MICQKEIVKGQTSTFKKEAGRNILGTRRLFIFLFNDISSNGSTFYFLEDVASKLIEIEIWFTFFPIKLLENEKMFPRGQVPAYVTVTQNL